MTKEERKYNFPTFEAGPVNLWVDVPGHVPSALIQMADQFHDAVKLGSEAPDFTGKLIDGTEFKLSSLRNNSIVLLAFGSITDPSCVSSLTIARPSLVALYREYASKGIEFVWVYTREVHPGKHIPPHKSLDEKLQLARRLKQEAGILFPMVVDSLDGQIHSLYGSFFNMNFVLNRQGLIISKSLFLDPTELSAVLDDALAWEKMDDGVHVIKKTFHERLRMVRVPYDPECRQKECETLERSSGREAFEEVRNIFGFDPRTWKRVEKS